MVETPDALGTISLVSATKMSGENATCLEGSALVVVKPQSPRSCRFTIQDRSVYIYWL